MTDWRQTTWGELATLKYGKALRDYRNDSGPTTVFGTNGPIGFLSSAPQSEGPGVIVGRKGAYRGVHFSDGPFSVIDTAFWLQPTEEIDLRWAYYELLTHDINSMDSGSAIPSTSRDAFYQMPVVVPPLAEQRVIAETLGAIDDKIESNRRAIALSEELARSHFEKVFDLAQAADGVALSDLIAVNPRRFLQAGTPAPYLGMSSLPEFSAEVHEWETKAAGSGQRFISGDVLMARIAPCLENGKTAVVDMLQPGEVGWGSTEYVVLGPRGQISTPWIYCLVRDERVRDFAIQSMTGTSGRQRFQGDRLSQYRIAQPTETDLITFNTVAEPLFACMTQLRDENRRLAALRDAALPGLLSGRITVAQEFFE